MPVTLSHDHLHGLLPVPLTFACTKIKKKDRSGHYSQASDSFEPGFRHFRIFKKYIQWRIRWMMSRVENAVSSSLM
jgi:hypothetical protein